MSTVDAFVGFSDNGTKASTVDSVPSLPPTPDPTRTHTHTYTQHTPCTLLYAHVSPPALCISPLSNIKTESLCAPQLAFVIGTFLSDYDTYMLYYII